MGRTLGSKNKVPNAGIDELSEEFGVPSRDEVELMQFIDEVGPSTTIVDVFRKRIDGGRGHVGRCEPNVLFEDPYSFLRESYGPGTYILGFKTAQRTYLAWKTLHIEKENTSVAVAPVQSSAGDDHSKFMREQMQMQQNLITSLITSMKPMDLTPLVTLFAGNRGPDPAQMLTSVVAAFSALRGPQKDEDWLVRAKTIIELAKDLNPDRDNGGPENFWSVAREVGKEVLVRMNPPGGAQPRELPPGPAHVQIPAKTEEVQKVTTREQVEFYVRAAIGYLKTKAQADKDPGLYVDFILANDEDAQWGALLMAIQQGATFENLLQFDDEIRNNPAYQSWFKTVYDALHSEIFEPVDTGGAGGDKDNVVAHAEPGETGRGRKQSPPAGG